MQQRARAVAGRARFRPAAGAPATTWIGTSYGGWPLPDGALGADAVCYLAGLGEDASFDLALIARYGCDVHAFDPVPEAATYAATVDEQRFHFHPFGLWREDDVLRFYDAPVDGYVSRSATNMHGTGTATELPVRAIPSVMAELGHDRIDLLKLSVEGSEYALIDAILEADVPVSVLCVEFAPPVPLGRIAAAVKQLDRGGFALAEFWIKPYGWKACFAHARD
jgi:FkbM family methyltransferase